MSDEDRKRLITPNLIVIGSFLVDGFAAGSWKTAEKSKNVTLSLTPFRKLPKKIMKELEAEGDAMLEFYFPEASGRHVNVNPASEFSE